MFNDEFYERIDYKCEMKLKTDKLRLYIIYNSYSKLISLIIS